MTGKYGEYGGRDVKGTFWTQEQRHVDYILSGMAHALTIEIHTRIGAVLEVDGERRSTRKKYILWMWRRRLRLRRDTKNAVLITDQAIAA